MSFAHEIVKKLVTPGKSINNTKTYTADGSDSREIAVPDSTTDMQLDIAIDVSAVKSFFITSDQDLKVEANDGTTPTDPAIDLVAGVPYEWTIDSYDEFKFTVDVTKLFLTNASGTDAVFKLEVLQDTTP